MSDPKNEPFNCDPTLHAFVRFVEMQHDDGKPPLGMAMLLHVGGSIVTGTLISEKEFMQRGNDLWKSMVDVSDAVMAHLLQGTNFTSPEIKPYLAQFIHLAGAQVWSSTKEMDPSPNFPALWRGRLNRVDGYMILDQTILAKFRDNGLME